MEVPREQLLQEELAGNSQGIPTLGAVGSPRAYGTGELAGAQHVVHEQRLLHVRDGLVQLLQVCLVLHLQGMRVTPVRKGVQPGLGEVPTTQRRDLGKQDGISSPEKPKRTYLAGHVVRVLQGLVDFGLLQIIFWLFTQLFGKVLLVFHLNGEQPVVTAALQESLCRGALFWDKKGSAGT